MLVSLCIGAIVAEVLDILLPEHLKLHMQDHAPMITVILLSLYVLAYLEQGETKRDRMRQLGIKNIFRDRLDEGQMASYQALLATAAHELFIVGITLKDLSREQGKHLRDRAAVGCTIELLMLSPKFRSNKNPILDPVAHAETQDLTSAFNSAISKIRKLADDISKTKNGKLTVRFYETAPTLSLTVKDGRHPRGRMHLEIIPHQISSAPFRPIMDISKDGEDELFSDIYKRYRALWDESLVYIEVDSLKSPSITVNSVLDHEISKWLGLEPKWNEHLAAASSVSAP